MIKEDFVFKSTNALKKPNKGLIPNNTNFTDVLFLFSLPFFHCQTDYIQLCKLQTKSYNILKSKLILNLGVKTQIRAYPFYKAPE